MKTITNSTFSKLLHYLSSHDDVVFLDTAKTDEDNFRSMLFLSPVRRLTYHHGEDISAFLYDIKESREQGFYVAGWFGYEFGYMLEPALKHLFCRSGDRDTLLADLGVYEKRYLFDHRTGESDFPDLSGSVPPVSSYALSNLELSQTREEYISAIEKIIEYINAGDTYQVNYTLKLFFDFSGSPEEFYRELRRNQSVSYSAFIRKGEDRILSFSPELFFKKGNGSVVVKPMKGTMNRGRTPAEDEILKKALAGDMKNRSENVMIVDLLRNDLGRLMHCVLDGDVGVRSLFDVESYETLLQMTSTITAETTEEALASIPLMDFFKSLFPCGSVTGAPKIRTMEIINELEKGRRGVYTGAIGYLAPDGEAMFNVPIRTVVLRGESGEMGIGSGIVYDSDPEQEWQECLLKGNFLTQPDPEFHIIETLLYHQDDGYLFLEEHLQRLMSSASYFMFACDPAAILNELTDRRQTFNDGCMRVRLSLEKDGTFEVTSGRCDLPVSFRLPVTPRKGEKLSIAFSDTRVDACSTWFYHKTSRRSLYDREFSSAREKGLFDICFCNTEGEVTEGCITNLIVHKQGDFVTPPVRSGLLPGVMRGVLLRDLEIPLKESVLTMDDIREADALYLCNSVRGVVPVRLVE